MRYKTLVERIEGFLRESKPNYLHHQPATLSSDEIAERAVPLLEEILELMESGVLVKSKEYKDLLI